MAIPDGEFWSDNYYKHPPLTDEMLTQAEEQLGVRLPPRLVELLRIQNGGYTQGFVHPLPCRTTWAEDHVPLDALAGIVTDPSIETAHNLLQTEYMTKEWGLPPRQVLLAGDGHFWITLDYRHGDIPSVAWIDTECDEDIQVADSFDTFLRGLVPSSTYEEERGA
jgi:hypothetical protein